MPIVWNRMDSFQTRLYQSFVNLTRFNSTTYPATSSIVITRPEFCSTCEPLTSVNTYDQYALRVVTNAAPLGTITP